MRYLTGASGTLGQILSYSDGEELYRSDTNGPLSFIGNRFKLFQPEETLEFYGSVRLLAGNH